MPDVVEPEADFVVFALRSENERLKWLHDYSCIGFEAVKNGREGREDGFRFRRDELKCLTRNEIVSFKSNSCVPEDIG